MDFKVNILCIFLKIRKKNGSLYNNFNQQKKADLTNLQTAPSSSPASCAGPPLDISSCSANASASSSSMLFTACNAAQVTSISPLSVSFDTLITIAGKY